MTPALRALVWELAGDVGLARRRCEPDSSLGFTLERIAGRVETLDAVLAVPAAELVALHAPGDDEAIDEALRLVDEHVRRLHARLGRKAA